MGITEIYGEEATGKTSLSLSCLGSTEEPVLCVEADYYTETGYAERIVSSGLLYSRPRVGEEAFEVAAIAIRSGVRAVVIDSTANLLPLTEGKARVGSRVMNAHQRMLFHGCNCLRELSYKYGASVILVSQIRETLGKFTQKQSSQFEEVFRAVADCRIKTRLKHFTTQWGMLKYRVVSAEVIKAHSSPPGSVEDIHFWANVGLRREHELLKKLERTGVLERRGAYWVHEGGSLGPGYDETIDQIKHDYSNFASLARRRCPMKLS